jgi:hypothetical protein
LHPGGYIAPVPEPYSLILFCSHPSDPSPKTS